MRYKYSIPLVAVIAATLTAFLGPSAAYAQLQGGKASRVTQDRNKQPPPVQQQVKRDYSQGPGEMTIISYKPPKEGFDLENPASSGGKLIGRVDNTTQTLDVDPQMIVNLGEGIEVKAEQFEQVLLPGMRATVNWQTVEIKGKRMRRATTIAPTVTEVEGELQKMDAKAAEKAKDKDKDGVSLRLKPLGNSDWPDHEPDKRGTQNAMVRPRGLLCKSLEELSRITDENGQPSSLFDLQPEQRVRGKIVVCRNQAIVLALGVLGADGQIKVVSGNEGNNRDRPADTGKRGRKTIQIGG